MAGNGLRIARSQGMEGFTGNTQEFPIDPANTNPIYVGDPVILNAGYVEEFSGGTPGDVTNQAILGIFLGWREMDDAADIGATSKGFSPAWTSGAGVDPRAIVALPTGAFFHVKGASGVTYAQANVGTRYNLRYAAGSARTGSAVSLGAAGATGQCVLNGLADFPGNAWSAAEPILEVSVVRHQLTPALA